MTKSKPTPLSQIISIARAGSPSRAWALFVAEGWGRQTDDPNALTLKGRLLKDQAKAAQGKNRVRLYGEAAAAYAAAADIRTDSYPLINAAALALLGGKPERSAELAAAVLALIEDNPDEGENAYWRGATRSEALLLMGKETEARTALSDAIAKLPHAWEDHAATIGQFALILAEQGRDGGWLDRLRPPLSIHYSGMIRLQEDDHLVRQSIENIVSETQPGFAYGALAAGSDILFAQAFLDSCAETKSNTELHVILPFPIDQFRELSVKPFGDRWIPLYENLLTDAATVTIMGLDDPPLALAVELADQVAMGQAIRNSRNLQSSATAITVISSREILRPQFSTWKQAGHELMVLKGQRKVTTVGEFHEQKTCKSVGTLIWISNANVDSLHDLLGTETSLCTSERGSWLTFKDIRASFEQAKLIASCKLPEIKVGLLHDIMDIHNPSQDILQRAELLAGVSQPGMVTTDQTGAMALTLIGAAGSIEEIGELKTAWGAQPLWRAI